MSGYGTIETSRLRILMLGGPSRAGALEAASRAVGSRHAVTVLCNAGGLRAKLRAARAASELKPHLVHSVGCEGIASSAATIAAGVDRPLIASLDASELADRKRAAAAFARRAYGVILEREADADVLRACGVERPVYVMSSPRLDHAEDDRFYLGSIEIVYGRAIELGDVPLEGAIPKAGTDRDGAPLVGIGGLGGKDPT